MSSGLHVPLTVIRSGEIKSTQHVFANKKSTETFYDTLAGIA